MNSITQFDDVDIYDAHMDNKNCQLHRESKKTRHQTLGHNFANYYPIFKIFSLADSVVNLQQIRV